mgnify:CR=1 FL=1
MEDKLKKAKKILKKYNQEHLLHFYDELSEEEKNKLINQILSINFKKILTIFIAFAQIKCYNLCIMIIF